MESDKTPKTEMEWTKTENEKKSDTHVLEACHDTLQEKPKWNDPYRDIIK